MLGSFQGERLEPILRILVGYGTESAMSDTK